MPFLGTLAVQLVHVVRALPKCKKIHFARLVPHKAHTGAEVQKIKLLNVIRYTQSSGTAYSASAYPAAYHTIRFADETVQGQRDPVARLSVVPFDFNAKTVLDIGCNQGGILFALRDRISHGIGVDYDYKMINAANRMKSLAETHNLHFYVFDVDREPLDLLEDFLPGQRIDIILLLSVCMWIANWREVIRWCAGMSDTMLFESNGTDKMQTGQLAFLKASFVDVSLLANQSDDDPKCKHRKLYLCSGSLIPARKGASTTGAPT